jgi:hypothetical protein
VDRHTGTAPARCSWPWGPSGATTVGRSAFAFAEPSASAGALLKLPGFVRLGPGGPGISRCPGSRYGATGWRASCGRSRGRAPPPPQPQRGLRPLSDFGRRLLSTTRKTTELSIAEPMESGKAALPVLTVEKKRRPREDRSSLPRFPICAHLRYLRFPFRPPPSAFRVQRFSMTGCPLRPDS